MVIINAGSPAVSKAHEGTQIFFFFSKQMAFEKW